MAPKSVVPSSQVPSASTATPTEPDLVTRFKAVTKAKDRATQKDRLFQMSYSQLEEMTIRFGTAKVGQTFRRVVKEDPSYCQFFLSKYAHSEKPEHQEFVYFLNAWTERQELLDDPKVPKTSKDHGKASILTENPSDSESSDDVEIVSSVHASNTKSEELDGRMSRLETVLEHVVTQLQILTSVQHNPMMPKGSDA